MTGEARSLFAAGARSAAALLLGMVPWGVVTGVAMIGAGLTAPQSLAMSVLVYAGAAQLAVLPLVVVKAPLWVMFVTAFVINVRYIIYGAVLAPHFARLDRWWRVLLSYLTVDGMFALFVARYEGRRDEPQQHWFYFGGTAVLWITWQVASCIGIFGGALIPREWSLEFASTLALIALVMPLLYDRAVVCGAIVSGLVALPARSLPLNLGVIVSVVTGVAAGLIVAALARRRLPEPQA